MGSKKRTLEVIEKASKELLSGEVSASRPEKIEDEDDEE